jgi:hypothetical protein
VLGYGVYLASFSRQLFASLHNTQPTTVTPKTSISSNPLLFQQHTSMGDEDDPYA